MIPRQHHRLLFGGLSRQVEQQLSITLTFPEKESGSDSIICHGTQSEIEQARGILLERVPKMTGFLIPSSSKAKSVLESSEFGDLRTASEKEHQVQVHVYIPSPMKLDSLIPSKVGTLPPEAVSQTFSIMLYHHPSHGENAEKVKQNILDFLGKQEVKRFQG